MKKIDYSSYEAGVAACRANLLEQIIAAEGSSPVAVAQARAELAVINQRFVRESGKGMYYYAHTVRFAAANDGIDITEKTAESFDAVTQICIGTKDAFGNDTSEYLQKIYESYAEPSTFTPALLISFNEENCLAAIGFAILHKIEEEGCLKIYFVPQTLTFGNGKPVPDGMTWEEMEYDVSIIPMGAGFPTPVNII